MDSWYFYLFTFIYTSLALFCFIAPVVSKRRKNEKELKYENKKKSFKLLKKEEND